MKGPNCDTHKGRRTSSINIPIMGNTQIPLGTGRVAHGEFFLFFFFFCSLPLPFKTPLHIQPIRPLGTAVERNPGDRETPGTWRWRARRSGVQDSLLTCDG
ncbi:hypothetical protein ES332_A12G165700v1 [Gossypium tomentosum]|uniref:Uncharacterized protein n=1 Tax=Gossypium tomentosum TaxID=34277 RepID=A0A5D2MXH8_GOSTO|nr:hypothetical protein ES332_A12G165700v1 [Gossypium tomentosum]